LEGLGLEQSFYFNGHLVYLTAIGNILWPFGLFDGHWKYFVAICYTYFVVIGYIFPRFGILDQEKSGIPGRQ
jgi:hypothetical protein